MFQFGGATHDKDVLMGIAAECIVKLVAGEISEDDAKSWCDNRVTTLQCIVTELNSEDAFPRCLSHWLKNQVSAVLA